MHSLYLEFTGQKRPRIPFLSFGNYPPKSLSFLLFAPGTDGRREIFSVVCVSKIRSLSGNSIFLLLWFIISVVCSDNS